MNVPSFLHLLPSYYADHNIKWCGLSLWSVEINCPDCSLPWPPHFGEEKVVEGETGGITAVPALLRGVLSTMCVISPVCVIKAGNRTARATRKKVDFITSSQHDALLCTGRKEMMNTYALQQSQREGKSTQQPGQNIQQLSREGNRQKQERKKNGN